MFMEIQIFMNKRLNGTYEKEDVSFKNKMAVPIYRKFYIINIKDINA